MVVRMLNITEVYIGHLETLWLMKNDSLLNTYSGLLHAHINSRRS